MGGGPEVVWKRHEARDVGVVENRSTALAEAV
jgi:hypothetical protein